MEHYFTPGPTSRHDPRRIHYRYRGADLVFLTDAGVFSRNKIDRGTDLLLEAVHVAAGESFLDLGCGYGVVGIAVAATNPEVSVTMVDVNERACELARVNARLNLVPGVSVVCGDGLGVFGDLKFDCIATNPPIRAGKTVVHRLITEARDHLNPGGRFYLVVRTKQGARSVRAFVEASFGETDEPEIGGGYRVIRARA
ncbi:MAG: methyltransferase [Firmicutes bacterium]|nr:methyltransferase [Bacillota bacterium]